LCGVGGWARLLCTQRPNTTPNPTPHPKPPQPPETKTGQVLIGAVGSMLRHIADTYSIAVLVTNHVVGAGGGFGGGSEGGGGGEGRAAAQAAGGSGGAFKPALGAQWRGQPHMRVQLSRGPLESGVVVATLTAATTKVVGEQRAFVITDDGLRSV